MIGRFLDWLAYQTQGRDYWSRRNAIGRTVRPLCGIIGHDPQGDVQPVWSTSGPFLIPAGDPRTADYSGYDYKHADGHIEHVRGCVQPSGIVYFMRECSRCKKRIPVDERSARNKADKTAQTAAVMNRSRAGYGLPPISWDN